nr:hypothetical protein [Rhodococcus kyotonensis]
MWSIIVCPCSLDALLDDCAADHVVVVIALFDHTGRREAASGRGNQEIRHAPHTCALFGHHPRVRQAVHRQVEFPVGATIDPASLCTVRILPHVLDAAPGLVESIDLRRRASHRSNSSYFAFEAAEQTKEVPDFTLRARLDPSSAPRNDLRETRCFQAPHGIHDRILADAELPTHLFDGNA